MNISHPSKDSSKKVELDGQVILITGGRGVGKTTLCKAVIQMLRRSGQAVNGILSKAVFTNGVKTAISAVNLRTLETRQLAEHRSENANCRQGTDTGCWIFDETVLAWGNDILGAATPCEVLVVDELGPLEWLHGRGWTNGLAAIDSADYQVALVTIRPELLSQAIARWSPLSVIEVKQINSLPVDSVYQMVIARAKPTG